MTDPARPSGRRVVPSSLRGFLARLSFRDVPLIAPRLQDFSKVTGAVTTDVLEFLRVLLGRPPGREVIAGAEAARTALPDQASPRVFPVEYLGHSGGGSGVVCARPGDEAAAGRRVGSG